MLRLYKQSTPTPQEKEMIRREITLRGTSPGMGKVGGGRAIASKLR